MRDFLREHRVRLLWALGVFVYLQFLLMPTAVLFYELHHLTGINWVYWGYSVFKAAGYYFGVWPYQTLACLGIAVVIAVPWGKVIRAAILRFQQRGSSA